MTAKQQRRCGSVFLVQGRKLRCQGAAHHQGWHTAEGARWNDDGSYEVWTWTHGDGPKEAA